MIPTARQHEPAHDIFRHGQHSSVDVFFAPRSVAVIGASETPSSVGHTLFSNLMKYGFDGKVFPVNPKYTTIQGVDAYPDVTAIGDVVDLAVIATPAKTVPGVIRECAAAGVKGAVIITAGFRETGSTGLKLEEEILAEARRGKMRLIGPNCLGLMNPLIGLFSATSRAADRKEPASPMDSMYMTMLRVWGSSPR